MFVDQEIRYYNNFSCFVADLVLLIVIGSSNINCLFPFIFPGTKLTIIV